MTSFRPGWGSFPAKLAEFYSEYQLSTLTTLRPDGRPHTVPVGVILDEENECAWIITRDGSRKVANVREGARTAGGAGAPVTVCQVDGARWSTLEGRATVESDQESVARAKALYTERYRAPTSPDEGRVAIRIVIDRIVHSPMLADGASRPGR